MDQCYHDITMVISVRANVAAAARTLLLLITDAVHQALLPVYYLFTKACWESTAATEDLQTNKNHHDYESSSSKSQSNPAGTADCHTGAITNFTDPYEAVQKNSFNSIIWFNVFVLKFDIIFSVLMFSL